MVLVNVAELREMLEKMPDDAEVYRMAASGIIGIDDVILGYAVSSDFYQASLVEARGEMEHYAAKGYSGIALGVLLISPLK